MSTPPRRLRTEWTLSLVLTLATSSGLVRQITRMESHAILTHFRDKQIQFRTGTAG